MGRSRTSRSRRSRLGGDIGTTSRIAFPKLGRAAVVIGVTVVLALVFGGLFTAADPAFAHLVDNLVPEFDGGDIVARLVVAGIVMAFILEGGYLIRFRPRLDDMAPAPMRPVPRWEWALPLGVLDMLFIAFVAVQASILFGGHTHVLETEGLTYAEYARQGFWQLLWVSGLTMLVLSGVIRVAGRATAADRRLLRVLVGTLCATSVVVVISAIHRMWVYQQAYGFSTERLMVITIEVWLGAVFLLVAAAGIRMSARWLPRAVLVAGVLALLGTGRPQSGASDRRPQHRPFRTDRPTRRGVPVETFRGYRPRAAPTARPDPGVRDGAGIPTPTPGICSISRGPAPIVPSTVRCRTFVPPSAGTNTAIAAEPTREHPIVT